MPVTPLDSDLPWVEYKDAQGGEMGSRWRAGSCSQKGMSGLVIEVLGSQRTSGMGT